MTFAIIAPPVATQKWKNIFEEIAPQIPLIIGTETNCPEDVVCVMVWNHPRGALKPFTNLKLIFSMGAGVDHIMNDDTIPLHIPICRVIDPQMAFSMSNYILMAVLNYHRSFYEFQNAQQNRHWAQFEFHRFEFLFMAFEASTHQLIYIVLTLFIGLIVGLNLTI